MPAKKSINYGIRSISLLALGALLGSFVFPHAASAQCSREAALGFQNISPEPNNPFEAEFSVNITSTIPTPSPHIGFVPRLVARDSRGRVRVEHSRGQYQVQRADGTQSNEDRVSISICDPSTGVYVRLDSLNKTATVRSSVDLPKAPQSSADQPFCARMFDLRTRNHDADFRDLGHQLIAGFDAHGLRVLSQLSPDNDTAPSFTSTDTWCSEDLAAIIGVVVVSANGEHHRETLLQKVSRKEPDPALFEIPAGYTRVEREGSADHQTPGWHHRNMN